MKQAPYIPFLAVILLIVGILLHGCGCAATRARRREVIREQAVANAELIVDVAVQHKIAKYRPWILGGVAILGTIIGGGGVVQGGKAITAIRKAIAGHDKR